MAVVLLALPPRNSAGETESGLSVQVAADSGNYRITAKRPAWTFAGSLGVPLKNVTASRGRDGVGGYQQTSFAWRDHQRPMSGQIRLYGEKALALFSQTCGVAAETPPAAFPAFTKLPEITAHFQLRPS